MVQLQNSGIDIVDQVLPEDYNFINVRTCLLRVTTEKKNSESYTIHSFSQINETWTYVLANLKYFSGRHRTPQPLFYVINQYPLGD